MTTLTILDPRVAVPEPSASKAESAGPPVGDIRDKRIGLRIDEMWESWGWVASEWEQALRDRGAEPLVWRAPIVKGAKVAEASAEFETFKEGIDAAIVGLCNCGSCSYWAIHDALGTLDAGVPTLVVATEHFERLARVLAAKGGRTDLRLVVLPYPLEGRVEDDVRAVARQHFESMLDTFGATTGE